MNRFIGLIFTFATVIYTILFFSTQVVILVLLMYLSIAFFFGEIEGKFKRR